MEPKIEAIYDVSGDRFIHEDYEYSLFSALAIAIQKSTGFDLHQNEHVLISPIWGNKVDNKILLPQEPLLKIRMPISYFKYFLPLNGLTVALRDRTFCLTFKDCTGIRESSCLYCSRVINDRVIHEASDNQRFGLSPQYVMNFVRYKINEMGIKEAFKVGIVTSKKGVAIRNVLQFRQSKIVGFPVVIQNLSNEASVKIQTIGIGTKKKMGCGFFHPTKKFSALNTSILWE